METVRNNSMSYFKIEKYQDPASYPRVRFSIRIRNERLWISAKKAMIFRNADLNP
jgi:hypothetical protein